jgi:hypothetical protein
MDDVMRTMVWVALFGGTGVVLVMVLPRIVIGCLEIVQHVHARNAHRRESSLPRRRSRDSLAQVNHSELRRRADGRIHWAAKSETR